ncbi:unnamed protein product [Schistosoma curassoni]|uniref:Homeobox protein 2-like n=1 Tax=Schistosoma curassoni TaxID=6186 RepID=A0A183KLY5_9TREM|nr:unnamed protein product [Schistosoma curassoni]
MNDTKLSGIYKKINQKQPNRILPRRPRSLIQDNHYDININNNNNNHNNNDQYDISNELRNNHGYSYNNIYDSLHNNTNEYYNYKESTDDLHSITPNLFRKYDSQQSYHSNNTINDNISMITDGYHSYDYRCNNNNNEIVNKTRTWTKTDLDVA